jgi:PRTRC genetic system protein B
MTVESPPPGRPRPYQRHRVRTPAPDVVIADGAPIAQVTIYDRLILLARRDGRGGWRQYPVSAEAVAQALSNQPSSSGLLPANTLAAGAVHGHPFLAVYVPPGTRLLKTERRDYTIPLPPLVWAGCGDDYRVFALGKDGMAFPTVGSQPLYAAPMPNTYESGAICWGSTDQRPQASATGLARAWKLFLESHFNAHVQNGKSKSYPQSILALWDLLSDRTLEPYPLEDLVATPHTLNWLCQGGPWAGGGR